MTDMKLEVRCDRSGVIAEAPDLESLVVAARTLAEDAWAAMPVIGNHPTVTFLIDGAPVITGVSQGQVWAALGSLR